MDPRMTPAVRRHSLKVSKQNPEDTLSQALGTVAMKEEEELQRKERELQEWRDWLRSTQPESDPQLKALDEQRQEVVDLWKEFGKLFPDVEPTQDAVGLGIPTLDKLHAAVNDARKIWIDKQQTGFGRVREGFLGFLDAMNDYSWAFSVIPSNDKYTSLVTGIVSTIVKLMSPLASSNNKKIAESFAFALADIGHTRELVQRLAKTTDTPQSRRYIIRLHIQIFDFLCYIMSWYKSWRKRFASSMNKNFRDDEVDARVKAIEKTAQWFYQEAGLVSNERIFGISEQMSLDKLQSIGKKSRTIDSADLQASFEWMGDQFQLKIVGVTSGQHLGAVEQHFLNDRTKPFYDTTAFALDDNLGLGQDGADDETPGGNNELLRSTRDEVLSYLRYPAPFIEDAREEMSRFSEDITRPVLPRETVVEIQERLRSPKSEFIWIEGASRHFPSALSLAAIHVRSITMSSGVPCASHFCKPRYAFPSALPRARKLSHGEPALLSLLYSLVAQFAHLLPDEFDQAESFGEGVFKVLDGTEESYPAALKLIQTLLQHSPPSLVLILDGIHKAEDRTTMSYLQSLVEILRDQQEGRILKVLFTTDENSRVLMREIPVFNRINATRLTQRGQQRLSGGVRVKEVVDSNSIEQMQRDQSGACQDSD